METLLNVVHNSLFEILWIFAEHSDAGGRLCHHCLLTAPDGLGEIMLKQANNSV